MNDEEREREQFMKQFEAGKYMRELRGERSLAQVCKGLEVSPNYLSSVEHGKLPSDNFIAVAEAFYGVDEDSLFIKWGKVPLVTNEVVRSNVTLQRTLSQIGRNPKLTCEDKEELFDQFYETFLQFIKRKARE